MRLSSVVGIAPSRPAEFVIFTITHFSGDAQTEEQSSFNPK
jgi:hypothetical protein